MDIDTPTRFEISSNKQQICNQNLLKLRVAKSCYCKNWDTLYYYRDCPTNGRVGFYSALLRSKDADRITNRVDTDQTAP